MPWFPSTGTNDDPTWQPVDGVTPLARSVFGNGLGVAVFHATDSSYPPHSHGGHRLIFSLQGLYHERCLGESNVYGPSDVAVIPSGEVHQSEADMGSVRWLALALPGDAPLRRNPTQRVAPFVTPMLWRLARACLDPVCDPVHVESLCAEIEGAVTRVDGKLDSSELWVEDAMHRLVQRPLDIESLSRLSGEIGVHRCHMARAMRERFGMTPGEILQASRLRLAAQALAQGTASIASIAQESGFYDQSHLGKCFKKWYGVSPAAYRRSFRS